MHINDDLIKQLAAGEIQLKFVRGKSSVANLNLVLLAAFPDDTQSVGDYPYYRKGPKHHFWGVNRKKAGIPVVPLEEFVITDSSKLPFRFELAFQFESLEQWVNKASSWFKPYKQHETVAVDSAGNSCTIGEHFMYARDNKLFPIKVYVFKNYKDK